MPAHLLIPACDPVKLAWCPYKSPVRELLVDDDVGAEQESANLLPGPVDLPGAVSHVDDHGAAPGHRLAKAGVFLQFERLKEHLDLPVVREWHEGDDRVHEAMTKQPKGARGRLDRGVGHYAYLLCHSIGSDISDLIASLTRLSLLASWHGPQNSDSLPSRRKAPQ